MHATPQHRLAVAGLIVSLVASAAIYLALQVPVLGLGFANDGQRGLVVRDLPPTSPNSAVVVPGSHVLELGGLRPQPSWLIEEPDNLQTWAQYNDLLDDFRRLAADLADGRIDAVIDGRHVTLAARTRGLGDLPALFWVQLLVGVVSFLIATGVYAFRPNEIGALHFAMTGLCLLLGAGSAAVYSTRELVIDGDTLRWLSAINWIGPLGFIAALAALLRRYPRPGNYRFPLAWLLYCIAFLAWIAFVRQLWPTPSTVYWVVIALFALTFVFAWLQWQRTARHPVERATLKWYLLSIYLGSGLFVALILVPAALDIDPIATQATTIPVFIFMFIGIAFGITRYRLFDLDRWWLSAWIWFLGGISVFAVDALLLWLLGLGHETSLALALALVGWVWFPVRQWAFAHLLCNKDDLSRQLQGLVQGLFGSDSAEQLSRVLQRHLTEEWALLELQTRPGRLEKAVIDEHGQALKIPHLSGDRHLVLRHPQHGSRLFTSQDRETIELLYLLARQALEGLQERHAAREERQRILGDLHDDVGSKLLSLLHRAADADSSELARTALQDLRDVVSQPDSGMQPLDDALADWRAEAQERLDGANIAFEWEQSDIQAGEVPVFQLRHIARILREALNNVIRHADASAVSIRVEQKNDRLRLAISDNGTTGEPTNWREGRGMSNIRHRLDKLGGTGQWWCNEQGGCTLSVSIPLKGA